MQCTQSAHKLVNKENQKIIVFIGTSLNVQNISSETFCPYFLWNLRDTARTELRPPETLYTNLLYKDTRSIALLMIIEKRIKQKLFITFSFAQQGLPISVQCDKIKNNHSLLHRNRTYIYVLTTRYLV